MTPPPSSPFAATALRRTDLVGLHERRTKTELDAYVLALLGRLLPGRGMALLLDSGIADEALVELVWPPCPLRAGQPVRADGWRPEGVTEYELPYNDAPIGRLLIAGSDDGLEPPDLTDLLAHLGTAIVNVHLGLEAQRSTDLYCASLQAIEEGIVLFQERNRDAVGARLMKLIGSVLGAPTGALFVLERIGDPDSPLHLDQCLGVPTTMLDRLRTRDGGWWPAQLVRRPVASIERDADGHFAELDDSGLPPVLSNIVSCPLRYFGVEAGVCLVFNAPSQDPSFRAKLDSVRRLGELGAALYHGFSLQEAARQNQALQTQLSIAATIQTRLLPRDAPTCRNLECAWRSQPAQSVGGDYLDLFNDELGDAFAVIADVSGHGIDSALLMTSFRSTYRATCPGLQADALMEMLNNEVHNEVGQTGMFITAASVHITRDGRKLTYASAGHNPLLLFRANSGALQELDSTGPSLGFFPASEYDRAELVLHPGDVLLLYTDGVVEETDDHNDMFGIERLRKCLAFNAARPAQAILDTIYAELAAFSGRQGTADDVSVTVIKIL